jgi:hypothetical protein
MGCFLLKIWYTLNKSDYMDIPKAYLETTMFNFLFVPDKPGYSELKAQVDAVFTLIKAGKLAACCTCRFLLHVVSQKPR